MPSSSLVEIEVDVGVRLRLGLMLQKNDNECKKKIVCIQKEHLFLWKIE